MSFQWTNPNDIIADWKVNPREKDDEHIRSLASHMNEIGYIKEYPIIVYNLTDAVDKTQLYAATGHHRLAAATLESDEFPSLPLEQVYVEVMKGTRTDYIRRMLIDNFEHTPGFNRYIGKMPSPHELRTMRYRLLFFPDNFAKGDRLLAKEWGCDHKSIGKIRDAIIKDFGNGNNPIHSNVYASYVTDADIQQIKEIVAEDLYIGIDGKKRPRTKVTYKPTIEKSTGDSSPVEKDGTSQLAKERDRADTRRRRMWSHVSSEIRTKAGIYPPVLSDKDFAKAAAEALGLGRIEVYKDGVDCSFQAYAFIMGDIKSPPYSLYDCVFSDARAWGDRFDKIYDDIENKVEWVVELLKSDVPEPKDQPKSERKVSTQPEGYVEHLDSPTPPESNTKGCKRELTSILKSEGALDDNAVNVHELARKYKIKPETVQGIREDVWFAEIEKARQRWQKFYTKVRTAWMDYEELSNSVEWEVFTAATIEQVDMGSLSTETFTEADSRIKSCKDYELLQREANCLITLGAHLRNPSIWVSSLIPEGSEPDSEAEDTAEQTEEGNSLQPQGCEDTSPSVDSLWEKITPAISLWKSERKGKGVGYASKTMFIAATKRFHNLPKEHKTDVDLLQKLLDLVNEARGHSYTFERYIKMQCDGASICEEEDGSDDEPDYEQLQQEHLERFNALPGDIREALVGWKCAHGIETNVTLSVLCNVRYQLKHGCERGTNPFYREEMEDVLARMQSNDAEFVAKVHEMLSSSEEDLPLQDALDEMKAQTEQTKPEPSDEISHAETVDLPESGAEDSTLLGIDDIHYITISWGDEKLVCFHAGESHYEGRRVLSELPLLVKQLLLEKACEAGNENSDH